MEAIFNTKGMYVLLSRREGVQASLNIKQNNSTRVEPKIQLHVIASQSPEVHFKTILGLLTSHHHSNRS